MHFMEKLKLKFIEDLWYEIKKTCMQATTKSGNAETITMQVFLKLCRQLQPNFTVSDENFLEQLFSRVDSRKRGAIRTTDIATALVLIANEDPIPKLRTLFRVFDADDDSCLTHDEIFEMYFSIKVNNITRTREELLADNLFEDELSLQEAKRLYELTVEHLKSVSDFVIFDEFEKAIVEPSVGHFLQETLLPGTFSLKWILAPCLESKSLEHEFGVKVKVGVRDALRRGEEHLHLSKSRGRGTRIMQNCLNMTSHRPPEGGDNSSAKGSTSGAEAPKQRSSHLASLPKLGSADEATRNKRDRRSSKALAHQSTGFTAISAANSGPEPRRLADFEDIDFGEESEDESDIEDTLITDPLSRSKQGGFGHGRSTAQGGSGHNGGGVGPERVFVPEGSEVQSLPWLSLNYPQAQNFRAMMLDAKTQQAYMRDRKEMNRTTKYQCLVCAVNHEFKFNRTVHAEHQH